MDVRVSTGFGAEPFEDHAVSMMARPTNLRTNVPV